MERRAGVAVGPAPAVRLTLQLDPVPELHLQPVADARYELVAEVLADAKTAGVRKLGFVGNEAYTASIDTAE